MALYSQRGLSCKSWHIGHNEVPVVCVVSSLEHDVRKQLVSLTIADFAPDGLWRMRSSYNEVRGPSVVRLGIPLP